MRAITVNVYRHGENDCTNGGISSKFDTLLCLCDDGPHQVDMSNPPENLVKVVKRELFGQEVYHVEPVADPVETGWLMGGNYAASPDSRFAAMAGYMHGALAIHDRQESPEEYDRLSR